MSEYFAHTSAIIDDNCTIGNGTKIWHFCHIMPFCTIGNNCNIGQNVVISPQVIIGNNKIDKYMLKEFIKTKE